MKNYLTKFSVGQNVFAFNYRDCLHCTFYNGIVREIKITENEEVIYRIFMEREERFVILKEDKLFGSFEELYFVFLKDKKEFLLNELNRTEKELQQLKEKLNK